MPVELNAVGFLEMLETEKLPLIDTRSESEFRHAHIPGAENIPILIDEHRHLVGTDFKKNGRESAVRLGFELAGPRFHSLIKRADELSPGRKVMLYCWRGGMRSNILAWLLSLSGFEVFLLKGGYKSFRNLLLNSFPSTRKIIIIGGNTGSGKTEILEELRRKGEQVINLEVLAAHRGSAFGALGMPAQPSNEHFENMLGLLWSKSDPGNTLWIEGESRTIGQIKIPDILFEKFQSAPLIEVCVSRKKRMQRILDEYGSFPKNDLAECTSKIRKRLGNLRHSEALFALEQGRLSDWLEILLDYYDKNYAHSLQSRNSSMRLMLEASDNLSCDQIADKLIQMKYQLHNAVEV